MHSFSNFAFVQCCENGEQKKKKYVCSKREITSLEIVNANENWKQIYKKHFNFKFKVNLRLFLFRNSLSGFHTTAVCLFNQEVELCLHRHSHTLPCTSCHFFLRADLHTHTLLCECVCVYVLQGQYNCECNNCMTITVYRF